MEVLDVSNQDWDLPKIEFKDFVKNVELNSQQIDAERRNKILLKKKNKENWLIKSKIIPPSFSKISNEPSLLSKSYNSRINLASFEDYRRGPPLIESQTELRTFSRGTDLCQSKDLLSKIECKTSHTIPRNRVNERAKSNWKLQYRRDQLNVLKYGRQEEEEQFVTSSKSFKLRKVQRKFQELKPSMHEIYRNNIDKTKQTMPSPKVRYRILNIRQ